MTKRGAFEPGDGLQQWVMGFIEGRWFWPAVAGVMAWDLAILWLVVR
jgi:hypothetical protein